MQRRALVRSLLAAVGLTQLAHAAPALALDEGELGREVFAELRDDGDLLFDSSYYITTNTSTRLVPGSLVWVVLAVTTLRLIGSH